LARPSRQGDHVVVQRATARSASTSAKGEHRRIPTWVQKPLACEFVAYSFAPSGVCYLLPVMPLQRAWRQRGREWIGDYGQRRAQNPGYVSVNVPVPKAVLMWAIVDAMIVGAGS
jgi:hypothetical protein